jgi:hypothetical protein
LEKLVNSGDVEAHLLAFDAKLRAGESEAARELLFRIDPESTAPSFRFPHAVAMAHLVLVGGFLELCEKATSLLVALQPAGGDQDKQVKVLMSLLSQIRPEP